VSLIAFHDEQLLSLGCNRLKLAVDFRALDLAEHLVGEIVPEILPKLFSVRPSLGASSKMLWAMLRRHHEEMTLDQAGGIIVSEHSSSALAAIHALLGRALNLGRSEDKGGKRSEASWSIETFLVEWIRLGGSPAEFWLQTPRSYVVIMEGMARAATMRVDLAIMEAWHTASFALGMYGGKLKGKRLSDFLTSSRATAPTDFRWKHAQALAFFHTLRERGVQIDISRAN
jgi:hypothetical protein